MNLNPENRITSHNIDRVYVNELILQIEISQLQHTICYELDEERLIMARNKRIINLQEGHRLKRRRNLHIDAPPVNKYILLNSS